MLQNAYIQNSGVYTGMGALTLTKATQLKELKLNGSTATVLELADGSVVETLYLNPLSTLIMSNLTRLQDIRLDDKVRTEEDLKQTSIFDTLSNVSIKNCPAFDEYSYELALRAPINYYVFNDFIWNITENNSTHFEYDASNNIIGIKVLDKLLDALTQDGYTTGTALVGTIHIDTDCSVDEFALYSKYCKDYSNLIITYSDKVSGLDPAVEIKFMGGEEASAAVHYRVLGSGDADGDSIGKLISTEGPTGIALTNPVKKDTSEYTYEFSGYWKDKETGNLYYVDGLENPDDGATNFNDIVPVKNMVFVPIFIEEIRRHEIKFYDYDGNVISQNGQETFGVPYGSTYAEAGGPMTNFWPLENEAMLNKLPEDKRYAFRGWSTAKFDVDEGKNMEFFDLENDIVKRAMNLHPYYETESVYSSATSEEYFEVRSNAINIKEKYRNSLKGKITLPNMAGATAVGDFSKMLGITHVFFLNNSTQYKEYRDNAFNGCENLVKIETPLSITTIKNSAFNNCYALKDFNFHNNITTIGPAAFAYCRSLEMNELPANLTKLESGCFRSCENIVVTKVPS